LNRVFALYRHPGAGREIPDQVRDDGVDESGMTTYSGLHIAHCIRILFSVLDP